MKKKLKKIIRIVSMLIILATFAFIFYGITNINSMNQEASILVSVYGISALFGISLFLDLVPQFLSPIIILGAGLLAGINIYYAILATVLGSTIGSAIGFSFGKVYMFDALDALSSKKSVKTLTRLTNKYGKIIVPLAAISPLPYLPVALGAMNFSKKNFIIFGLIPRALSITAYGILFGFL